MSVQPVPSLAPSEYTLTFPTLPELQADKMHRLMRAKYRKRWHLAVYDELRAAGWRYDHTRWNELGFEYTRASSGKRPDYINLVYSAKAMIDGLIGLLIEDDNDEIIPIQQFKYEKCKRIDQGVTLRLWRIS